MYEITSGNIVEGIVYQIHDSLTINYNGTEYTTGEYFTGVNGVTTYTFVSGASPTDFIVAETSDTKNAYPTGYTDVGQTWVNTINSETGTYAYELKYFNVYLHTYGTNITFLCEVFNGTGYGGTKLGEHTVLVIGPNGGNVLFNFTDTTPSILLTPDQTVTMKVTVQSGGTGVFGIGETATTYTYNVIKDASVSTKYWDFYIYGTGFDGPDGIVTEASTYIGQTTLIENDFFLGNFSDESKYLGQATNVGDPWLYEVPSGEIVPNIQYYVDGGASIVYNSITVNSGEWFTGVDSITTYTKTNGDELVTPASSFIGQSFGFENDFYLDLFNDDSKFLGISFGIANNPGYVISHQGMANKYIPIEIGSPGIPIPPVGALTYYWYGDTFADWRKIWNVDDTTIVEGGDGALIYTVTGNIGWAQSAIILDTTMQGGLYGSDEFYFKYEIVSVSGTAITNITVSASEEGSDGSTTGIITISSPTVDGIQTASKIGGFGVIAESDNIRVQVNHATDTVFVIKIYEIYYIPE